MARLNLQKPHLAIFIRGIVVFLLLVNVYSARAQQGAASYHEREIPMRDGEVLAADLYSMDTTVAKPVILVQTPYNKNFYRNNIAIPAQAGGMRLPYDSLNYHVVTVDWRGFFGSIGAATPEASRAEDGYDCVEWIANQSWCNGKVGTWGGSALGGQQLSTMSEQHPNHVCAMPLITRLHRNGYEEYYTGGVYRKEHSEARVGLGFNINLSLIRENPVYNNTWRFVEQQSYIFDKIQIPMLMASGWYDLFPGLIVRDFWKAREESAPNVRASHKLIMGPWTHMDMDRQLVGALNYPGARAYVDSVARRFFDYYLRDIPNGYTEEPTMRYYQMGENQWKSTETWPPTQNVSHSLFLHADGKLRPTEVSETQSASFTYDPRNPTPSYGGQRFTPLTPGNVTGPQDMRDQVESRNDVLLFETETLTEPLILRGPSALHSWVSIDQQDSDLSVRITDVHPDGSSYLLGEHIRKMRLRDTVAVESLLTPGNIYPVTVRLDDLAHTFLPGHRLRIIVCGASYPKFERSANNGSTLNQAGDTLVCNTTLHMSAAHPTHLQLQLATAPSARKALYAAHSQLRIYPNPANDYAELDFTVSGATPLAISDVLGKTVYAATLTPNRNKHIIQTGNWPAGVYTVRLGNAQAKLVVQ